MREIFCNVEYLHVAVVVLFLALVAQGAGRGLGALVGPLLRRLGSKNGMTVNVAQASPTNATKSKRDCLVNPENCPKHGEEKQRSLQNEKNIGELKKEFYDYREIFFRELKAIRRGTTVIIMALVAKKIIDPHDIPKEE